MLFIKDILRTLRSSVGRFVSIAAIMAIGVGVFIGLNAAAPDMKNSLSEYLRQTNAFDLRVVCSYGLDEASLDVLRGVEGIEQATSAISADTKITVNDCDGAFSAQSLPDGIVDSSSCEADTTSCDVSGYQPINKLTLVDGRWPTAANECVVMADTKLKNPINIDDEIVIKKTMMNVENVFVTNTFKVVGHVYCPTNINTLTVGFSTITEGLSNGVFYIPKTSFNAEFPITDAYLVASGADKYTSMSDEYNSKIDELKEKVNAVLPQIADIRLSSLQEKLNSKLTEKQTVLDDSVAQLDSELSSGMDKLNSALAVLDTGSSVITYTQSDLQNAQAQLDAFKKEAYAKINQTLDKLNSSVVDCNAMQSSFNTTSTKLNGYWEEIQKSQTAATNAYIPLKNLCDDAVVKCDTGKQKIQSSILKDEIKNTIIAALDSYKQCLSNISATCQDSYDQISQAKTEEEKTTLYNASLQKLAVYFSTVELLNQQFSQIFATANANLNNILQQVYSEQNKLQTYLDQAQQKINDATNLLNEKQSQLDAAFTAQEEASSAISSAQTQSEQKIGTIQQKLNEGKNAIESMSTPQLFVLDRNNNLSYNLYFNDSGSIAEIALVFPLFLLIIAALVCMSTMTRMVEEDRSRIGTCKALGYKNSYISYRYIVYGAISAIVGAIIGILICCKFIPFVVIMAYSSSYQIPAIVCDYRAFMFIEGCLIGVVITCGITLLTIYKDAKEVPAQLMRPPVPKSGKTILLEKIGPLWKRLSFLWKISLRNIFLYKQRLIMTLIGIAGCTAIMVAGFGASDCVDECVNYQYDKVNLETMQVTLSDSCASATEIQNVISSNSEAYTNFQTTNLVAKKTNGEDLQIAVYAGNDVETMEAMRPMHNRVSGQNYSFNEKYCGESGATCASTDTVTDQASNVTYLNGGIILGEKTAELCGVKAGDTITLHKQSMAGDSTDQQPFEMVVSGITENYQGNIGYVGLKEYQEKINSNITYSKYLIKNANSEIDMQLYNDIKSLDTDASITVNSDSMQTMADMMGAVKYIVLILIIFSALLTFVVVYNLTNINISERIGELATLKVLGNTDREVNSYVHKETLIMTFLGAIIGLFFGYGLLIIVLKVIETDMYMFGRDITAMSYILSAILTIVFTLVVIVAMSKKIKNINMVESLKSVE